VAEALNQAIVHYYLYAKGEKQVLVPRKLTALQPVRERDISENRCYFDLVPGVILSRVTHKLWLYFSLVYIPFLPKRLRPGVAQ
jgi:hypothetical protein